MLVGQDVESDITITDKMKLLSLILSFFTLIIGCGTTANISCPPPAIDSIKVPINVTKDSIVYVTLPVKHDTITRVLTLDSPRIITIAPTNNGDDWQHLQDASDFCIANNIQELNLTSGVFHLSKPWVLYKKADGDFQEFTLSIKGAAPAQDAVIDGATVLQPMYTNGPVIAIQKGKSGGVENIVSTGKYTLPNQLGYGQIDTYSWEQWSDGICTDGRTNPYCFIAVDPFSDPSLFDGNTYKMYDDLKSFYLPGMARAGSTGLVFRNIGVSNYVVGYVVTPSWQFNGELLLFDRCRADYCRAALAQTQAQSKMNKVVDFMCWGNTHTIFDGVRFGGWRGDGVTMPMIDGANIAGYNYQLIESYAYTFPISVNRVYAEGLFKIGTTAGGAGAHFTDCQIDLQLSGGAAYPMPDFILNGQGTTFEGGMIRTYGQPIRIVLNSPQSKFEDMMFSLPPICMGQPTIKNCQAYYTDRNKLIDRNDYDTILTIFNQGVLRLTGNWNGYFLTSNPEAYQTNDLITSPGENSQGDVVPFINKWYNNWLPVGYVDTVVGDTVKMKNVCVSRYDSCIFAPIAIWKYKSTSVWNN